jgi:hypothetical protein
MVMTRNSDDHRDNHRDGGKGSDVNRDAREDADVKGHEGSEELREELAAWLRGSEPPFVTTAVVVRSRARKTRARQTFAAVAACVAVVGGAAAVAAQSGAGSSAPEPSAPSRDSFSPQAYVETLTGYVRGRATSAIPRSESGVVAKDAQDVVIDGDDRRYATVWQAAFEISDGHVFDISTVATPSDTPADADAETLAARLRDDCSDEDAAFGETVPYDTCEVTTLSDSAVAYTQRQTRPYAGGWITIKAARADQGVSWFLQRVEIDRLDQPVTITEAVRAETIEQARTRFVYNRDDLEDIALDPALRFPAPPRNDEGCGWTVASQDGPLACLAVRPLTPSQADPPAIRHALEVIGSYYGDPGYGGAWHDETTDRIIVYWNGTPPAPITDLVQAPPPGTRVVVYPVFFTDDQLNDAKNAVLKAPASALDGAQVISAEPGQDRRFLLVEVAKPWHGSDYAIETVAGLPVSVQTTRSAADD